MTDIVAVYGTLRAGGRLHHHLGVPARRSRLVGRAALAGDLYEVALDARDAVLSMSYPCYYEGGHGRVVVELYEVLDASLWHDLDELEGYLPHDPDRSEYHRRLVPLLGPQLDLVDRADPVDLTEAWTYVYVRSAPDPARRIANGDWISFAG